MLYDLFLLLFEGQGKGKAEKGLPSVGPSQISEIAVLGQVESKFNTCLPKGRQGAICSKAPVGKLPPNPVTAVKINFQLLLLVLLAANSSSERNFQMVSLSFYLWREEREMISPPFEFLDQNSHFIQHVRAYDMTQGMP